MTIVGLAENSSCSTSMVGSAGAATLTLSDFDIVAEWPAIPRQKVSVIFSKEHDRTPLSPGREEEIDAEWQHRLLGNPHLGMTDYKTFIGTNMAHDWHEILSEAGQCCLANTLGNAALVECRPSQPGGRTELVLLRRSGNVGECPNTVVYPGGHPEPSGLERPLCSVAEWQASDPKEWSSEAVVDELYGSIAREVCEETGIDESEISDPLLIGIARRRLNHRSIMVFVIRCCLTPQEVISRYENSGVMDRFESTRLFCAPPQAPGEEGAGAGAMPGCHVAAAELYRRYVAREGTAGGAGLTGDK